MRKRPLCTLCLAVIIVRSLMLIASGAARAKPPDTSFFCEERAAGYVKLSGLVYKKTETSKNLVYYLKDISLNHGGKSYFESKIIIYDGSFSDYPIGSVISCAGTAYSFDKARNPGNFDARLFYAKQGIYGSVSAQSVKKAGGDGEITDLREEEPYAREDVNLRGDKTRPGKITRVYYDLSERLYRLRRSWKSLIEENMSEKGASVLSAMLLGERSLIDEDVKETYREAGISHVLAISGLHISFIGLGLYKLLRKTGLSRAAAGFFSMSVLGLYALMIGFSVSVIRAFIMLAFRIGADMCGRVYDMATALFFSAAALVLYEPLYLTDAAFLLSHGAILGIAAVLPAVRYLFPDKKWLSGFMAGLSINLTLLPVILWFYFEFPVYSMAVNLAVIPAMSAVLGLGMFGSFFCLIHFGAGRLLLKGCDIILGGFLFISRASMKLPSGDLAFGKPKAWEMAVYYALLLIFLCPVYRIKAKRHVGKICDETSREVALGELSDSGETGRRERMKKIALRCAGLIILTAQLVILAKFPDGKLHVTMIDVGQGDGIFMEGPKGVTYLIDGGSSDKEEVGKYVIEPFLKACGVNTLDYVFLSHGDNDHISGVEEMLARKDVGIRIKKVVMPANYADDENLTRLAAAARDNGAQVFVIGPDEEVTEGDLHIKCLQPDKNDLLSGNAGSMILSVSFGEFDMLFTGDVEAEGEESLIKKLPEGGYDVLKVAHHGSKNSTSEEFLKIANPMIALISAGEDNSYGHPNKETLDRLKSQNCRVYVTAESGALFLETDGAVIDILPGYI